MAENNSSAPLKTAEGAIAKAAQLLRECAEELKQAHTKAGLGYWDESESEVKAVYDEYIDTANALLSAPQPQAVAAQAAPAAVVYAEARECSHCNHVGINDSADGVAACISCAWHGDSPKDDKCPECEAEGTMTASCPKCHHEYRLLADASIATPALPATEDSSAGDLAAVQAEPVVTSVGWREQFSQAVYADLAAADNQDVPLEDYPGRILKVLDSIVGPHHPTVVHWRNDAIRACIEIVKRYGAGTTAYQERDMAALYTAPQAQPADAIYEPMTPVQIMHAERARRDLWDSINGPLDWPHLPEQDASRYRYLRARDVNAIDSGGVFAGMTPENVVLNGEDLDAAIDAAMAAAQEGGNAAKEA